MRSLRADARDDEDVGAGVLLKWLPYHYVSQFTQMRNLF